MRRLAPLFILLSSTVLHAQGTPAPARPDFAPLEFLVGSCWIGTFPDGKATDEHCFEWVYDRMFIRDKHVVRGGPPYEGESLYRWDPVAKRIAYWYWSSPGLVVTGTLESTPDGLVFPSKYDTANGEVQIKAIWKRTGEDSYRVAQSQRAAGQAEWQPLWTMELKRRK